VSVISRNYLTPTLMDFPVTRSSSAASTSSQAPSISETRGGGKTPFVKSDSILSKHMSTDLVPYLSSASVLAAASSSPGGATSACSTSATSRNESELHDALNQLREVLQVGLENRRDEFKAKEWYQAWHNSNKGTTRAMSNNNLERPQYNEEPELKGLADAASSIGKISDSGRQQAAALLAAMDAALLSLRLEAFGKYQNLRFHFATAVPGSVKIPIAQWMQAS
jgi:hypothetical protein